MNGKVTRRALAPTLLVAPAFASRLMGQDRAADVSRQSVSRREVLNEAVSPLQRLIDIEAIRKLKARYFRLLDTKQWDGWAMTFAPDATMEADSAVSTWGRDPKRGLGASGREQIRDFVRAARHETVTVHQGHTAEIDIVSATQATAIWLMEDIVDSPGVLRRSHGHYHETYQKIDGQWYIKTLRLTRLRIEETHRTQPLGGDASLGPVQN